MTSNTRYPGHTFFDALGAGMDNAARALSGLPPRTHGRRAARDGVGAINVDRGPGASRQAGAAYSIEAQPEHRA